VLKPELGALHRMTCASKAEDSEGRRSLRLGPVRRRSSRRSRRRPRRPRGRVWRIRRRGRVRRRLVLPSASHEHHDGHYRAHQQDRAAEQAREVPQTVAGHGPYRIRPRRSAQRGASRGHPGPIAGMASTVADNHLHAVVASAEPDDLAVHIGPPWTAHHPPRRPRG
jgi:hypothetical protein